MDVSLTGPCYRCLYPQPPSPENCSRCSEAGVLGPVPGVIGTLQAMEVIKLITGQTVSFPLTCSSERILLIKTLLGA